MNFVHVSISLHFVWLIWLSLQFYDHDVAIARIMGLVLPLPSDDVEGVGADDSGVLDDDNNNLDSSLASRKDRPQLHDNDSYVHHSKDLVLVHTEMLSHKRHQINKHKKKHSTREVMRGSRLLPRDNKKSSEIKLNRRSVLKDDNALMKDFNRKAVQNSNENNNVETKCFLTSYDDSTYVQNINQNKKIPNETATFTLDFDLMTDLYSDESYWSLVNQNNNEEENKLIIDSKADDIQLLPNTLQRFKYSCFVTLEESEESTFSVFDRSKSKTCYTFTLSDSWGDGICCWGGLGFYSLKLNDKFPLISGRFYAYVVEANFCMEGNEYIPDVENNDLLYPSRECIGETCFCDSKPKLLSNFNNIEMEHPDLSRLKIRTFANILTLSGTGSLKDTNSPQYMAACWTLNDDPYLTQYESITTDEFDAETRMMQRYILAVYYFSTKPQNWSHDLNFLTSKSECEWFVFDEDKEPVGMGCDENNNIISIKFNKINLEGPLVDEFSGLKSIKFMAFVKEPKMIGSIPTSYGLLSELSYLTLEDVPLVSTIPSELFNVVKMERLIISGTSITGTIPQSIGEMKELQVLRLRGNHLTGEIPDELYSLTQLRELILFENSFSSTISSSIENLNNLKILRLDQNDLSGPLPFELGRLLRLEKMHLSDNEFTSTIPSSLKSLSNIVTMSLDGNRLEGEVPDFLCELHPLPDIKADCRNDILQPDVKCSCCSYCTDSTPTWNGKCPGSTLRIVIDHTEDDYWFSSELLEWSITDTATNKQIMGDRYIRGLLLTPVYEMCIASSDCLSLNMTTGEIGSIHYYPESSTVGFETPYSIYWNDNLVLTDTVASDIHKSVTHPEVLFQYDRVNDEFLIGSSCAEIEIICSDKIIQLNPKQRILYNTAIKVSGMRAFDDDDSPHYKAFCWIMDDFHDTHISELETPFIQRYVLTILHLSSGYYLFGDGQYPPLSHECQWEGVECADKKYTVTSLSLSSASKKIIGGTLVEELASLKYLEKLDLSHSELSGTIPQVYSNLWSMQELNLSGNNIVGSIPTTLFLKLSKLKYINLSDNSLGGTINNDIGSYSPIRFLSLGKNLFTGSLPLDEFKYTDLEYLDISENGLSEIDFSLLLKHNNLKSLAISSNFFAGSLLEHTFTSLSKLEFFNISQNDFSGTILSTFPELCNITHFDVHSNQFKGPIPLGITELTKLQHLNLQGNYLTGSLPIQLNQLKGLTTLVLSHNYLKGIIPFDSTALQMIEKLHLHSNKLSGEAPIFNNLTSYITDCGFPSDSLDPVSCSSCNTCCNSDGVCQSKTSDKLSRVDLTAIFVMSIIAFISTCYAMKDYITSIKYLQSFFSETVFFWNAMVLINDKSVYHFLLAKNKTGWFLAVCCILFQTATLFLFVQSADMSNSISDREYTMICPVNSLECEDSNKVSSYGLFVFSLILTVWLLRDIIGSIKLMLVSFQKRSIDFFFASAVIFTVTLLSIWTSVVYIIAIAAKNTDMIKDAVVLLFVVEIDERIFQLVESMNPDWVKTINNNMRHSFVYVGDDLVITTWATKFSKSMKSMGQKIRDRYESFRKGSSKESVKSEE